MKAILRMKPLVILVAMTTVATWSMEALAGSPKRTRSSRSSFRSAHRGSRRPTSRASARSSHRSKSRTLSARSSSRPGHRMGRARSSTRLSGHRSSRRMQQRRTSRPSKSAARRSPSRSARSTSSRTGRSAHSRSAGRFQRSGAPRHTGSSSLQRTSPDTPAATLLKWNLIREIASVWQDRQALEQPRFNAFFEHRASSIGRSDNWRHRRPLRGIYSTRKPVTRCWSERRDLLQWKSPFPRPAPWLRLWPLLPPLPADLRLRAPLLPAVLRVFVFVGLL